MKKIGMMVVLVVGVFGCDSNSSQSASEVCDACDNSDRRGACESTYNNCRNVDGGGHEECVALGLAACGI